MTKACSGFEYNSEKTLKNIYALILQRCNNPTNDKYHVYGARGICCDLSFEEFSLEIGERPSAQHSVDRLDNNGNYCKGNLRWATPHQQANNMSTNLEPITYKGETRTITEWANLINIKPNTLHARIHQHGWSVEEAMETELRKPILYTFKGQSKTIREWANAKSMSTKTLHTRLFALRWSIEKALQTPIHIAKSNFPTLRTPLILDGPNGSGKSTLGKKLSEFYSVDLIHAGAKPDSPDEAVERSKNEVDNMSVPIIRDRCNCISHLVYHPDLSLNYSIKMFNDLELVLKQAIIIYCVGEGVNQPKDYYTEEHKKEIIENKSLYRNRYNDLMSVIPCIRYDFEAHSFQWVLDQIQKQSNG